MAKISKASIFIEDVSKSFFRGGNDSIHALDRVSFNILDGEFFSLLGASGCGKSTLLYIIDGLISPTSGKVSINGKINPKPARDRGMVFQEYALFPWRTTLENIEMGLEIRGMDKASRRSIDMEYIKTFGLNGFEHRYPRELSGGMKQRVPIARTLVMNPRVVLMDEPFGSLDRVPFSRLTLRAQLECVGPTARSFLSIMRAA